MEHARDETAPVMDENLAGHGAHPLVAERRGDRQQRVGRDHAVRIDRDQDVAPRTLEARRQGRALAAVALSRRAVTSSGKRSAALADIGPGVVLAAIVDHQDLEPVVRIIRLGHRPGSTAAPWRLRYRRG